MRPGRTRGAAGARRASSSSESACSSLPLIAPGPSPSVSPIALAVTAWSPVIMRTSIPAPSAVWTARFASARSGSMMPTMPTKSRFCVSDIGSRRHRVELVVLDEPRRERQDPQPLLAHPLVGGVDVGPRVGDRDVRLAHRAAGAGTARQHDVGTALDELHDALAPVERHAMERGHELVLGVERHLGEARIGCGVSLRHRRRAWRTAPPARLPSGRRRPCRRRRPSRRCRAPSPSARLVKSGTGTPATDVIAPVLR